uniref:Putative secreted protein n=1 Tax=Ixodes ricinus TaxID=34613 RepID=V5IDB4_IXORI
MIKIMFLAIFAALVTLHADVNGGLVKPEEAYNCYWAIANASDRVCRNHEQDGFFFQLSHLLQHDADLVNIERRLTPGITVTTKHVT